MNIPWPRYHHEKFWSFLSLLFVSFGMIVRLRQYLANRSLWFDEVNLVLNIVHRSYGELLGALDYNQAAPPLFLWIEKLLVQLWGDHESALRLFPLMASGISLWAFYCLAHRLVPPAIATLAIALFASLRFTVYYATEVKQYSSDVMVALLLSLLLIAIAQRKLTLKTTLGAGLGGAIAIWLSHPAIFVLGGMEAVYGLRTNATLRWSRLLNRLPLYLLWLLSFAGLYLINVQNSLDKTGLASAWSARYPDGFWDLLWLLDAFGRFFYRPLGFSGVTDGIAMGAFVLGGIMLFRHHRLTLALMSGPILATLIASYLHQYPFRERVILFLVPFALIILAAGMVALLQGWRSPQRLPRLGACFGLFMVSALLLPALIRASHLLVYPEQKHEFRPVLEYIHTHQAPGDHLYVYAKAAQPFKYYGPKYGYQPEDYRLGVTELPVKGTPPAQRWVDLEQELNQWPGQSRVWFLFVAPNTQFSLFASALNRRAQPLDCVESPYAFAYLYRFD